MNRVLVVDKPGGMTSHDVVARVRKALGIRRVGHTGTLDPSATGVLIVLTGRATRLAQFFVDLGKEYRGRMVLGVSTDSQDADGEVTAVSDPTGVTEADVRSVFAEFVGEIEQVPPMVSALKRDGTPLYVLARRGEVVEREPRSVTVERMDVLSFDPPEVEFEVECSRGTYVRTLVADAGERLGCGAHLRDLCRTRIGPFRVEDALPIADLGGESSSEPGMSMYEGLTFLPAVRVSEREVDVISTGGTVSIDAGRTQAPDGQHVRLTPDGIDLVSVGRVAHAPDGQVRISPVRVFVDPL